MNRNRLRKYGLGLLAGAFVMSIAVAKTATAQTAAAAPSSAAAFPRLPDGHPDFRGIWYKAGGFGPDGTGAPGGGRGTAGAPGGDGRGAAAAGAPAGAGARGGGRGAPGPPRDPTTSFRGVGVPKVPYTPAGLMELKWRVAHEYLDGEPRCHLAGVPRAAEQPPYPHQIIQDDKSITILYEYVHEPRIIPIDNSAHPRNYWAWDGDSRAHWEGDTLIVDVANGNGRTWLDMGSNFVDENLHVVERYTPVDANTYLYEATLTDPGLFTEPWTMKFNVRRRPDDQLYEYSCHEGEQDRQHYTDENGGKLATVVANGELVGKTAGAKDTLTGVDQETIWGCLRLDPKKAPNTYVLETRNSGDVKVVITPQLKDTIAEYLFREVRFAGNWNNPKSKSQFDADNLRVLAEGCSWNGK